jgi:hypothetical protein
MYTDFSSMPPEQEREFVVFEKFSVESAKGAWKLGYIVAGVYGLLMIVIVLSHSKPPPLIAEEPVEEVAARRPAAPVQETAPAPEPVVAAEPAADEPAQEAPPPKPGATKASPTDLVKPK